MGDDGFGLLEVVVALAILAVTFMAIEWGALGSFTTSVLAEQRATATGLATQAIAETQALPFADLHDGLNLSQLQTQAGTWPEVSDVGGSYQLSLSGVGVGTLLTGNAATTGEAPLVPFAATQQVSGTTYTIGMFPTSVSGSSHLVTVTAVVAWFGPPNHDRTTVVEQAVVGLQ